RRRAPQKTPCDPDIVADETGSDTGVHSGHAGLVSATAQPQKQMLGPARGITRPNGSDPVAATHLAHRSACRQARTPQQTSAAHHADVLPLTGRRYAQRGGPGGGNSAGRRERTELATTWAKVPALTANRGSGTSDDERDGRNRSAVRRGVVVGGVPDNTQRRCHTPVTQT